jgi:hypothetical protein
MESTFSKISLNDTTTVTTVAATLTFTSTTEHPASMSLLLPTTPVQPIAELEPPSTADPSPKLLTFRQYASKLGYPHDLITRVLTDLGPDAETEDLLSHLISLQELLCPDNSLIRRRRDATLLPPYMLSQDSYYKGKEKMPYWVWVKRETITADVQSNPPHKRMRTRTRSGATSSHAPSHSAPNS